MRVIQLRDRAGFPREAIGKFGFGNLEGDDGVETRIASLIDLAHPPAPRGETISYGPRRSDSERAIVGPDELIRKRCRLADCESAATSR